MFLLPLAFALAASAAPADTVPAGGVSGSVLSDPSGLPVGMAVVEVRDAGSYPAARVITDSTGAYSLRGIAAGRHTLRVRHLEHAPLSMEVLVPAGGTVRLDLTLRYRPLALDTVRAFRPGQIRMGDTTAARRSEVARVDSRAMDEGTGFDNALPLPSEPPPADDDPDDVFRSRSATADLKLVLLDGAPVYTPFHMGGLMDAFEPGVLHSAEMYLGGAPARYDGGLSYVVDLSTRGGNAERHAFSGAVDVVTARAMAEGPLPRGSTYLVSGRVVHGAWMRGLEAEDFPYRYVDGLMRLDVPVGNGVLRATGFRNLEGATFDDNGLSGWVNTAGSLRYRGGILGEEGELTLAHGGFATQLRDSDEHILRLKGNTRRGRVALDLGSSLRGVRLRYGASYDYTRVRYDVDEQALGWVPLVNTNAFGATASGYVEGSWQPVTRVRIRGGVRGDAFARSSLATLSPRGSVTWLVGDRAALTMAAGRYHQLVRTHLLPPERKPETLEEIVRQSVASELRVASANHFSVGLDQEVGDGLRLGVEGFFKRFRHVPSVPGPAYNSGMDLWVRRGTGAVTGWLGYTLTWAWTLEDEVGRTPDSIVGRQVLSAGIGAPLGRLAKLSARFQYGSGLSASELLSGDADGPLNLPAQEAGPGYGGSANPILSIADGEPYVRLDAQISRTWSPRVAGRLTEVTPYFRVINALDQREPLFYQSRDGGGVRAVGGFPILPVLGFEWKW